jgi:hypothetical protein
MIAITTNNSINVNAVLDTPRYRKADASVGLSGLMELIESTQRPRSQWLLWLGCSRFATESKPCQRCWPGWGHWGELHTFESAEKLIFCQEDSAQKGSPLVKKPRMAGSGLCQGLTLFGQGAEAPHTIRLNQDIIPRAVTKKLKIIPQNHIVKQGGNFLR